MTHFAYARVSTRDQNLSRQLEAFRQFGIERRNVFCDKESGKDFDRTNYLRMIRKLRRGDLLVVHSIDRLGRNYTGIIEEWTRITKKIQADILVLDMPLLDTRSKPDSLVGTFISDIVLQVLSFVAENERDKIRVRQAEGIAAAKQRGVKFGRPPKLYDETFRTLAQEYRTFDISLKDASKRLGLSVSNCYYHFKRYFGARPRPLTAAENFSDLSGTKSAPPLL